MSSSHDKKPLSSQAGGVRTLSDLNRPSAPVSDQPHDYYTGSEKCGMLVQDPSKGNNVDAIFDQARQAGSMHGPLENIQPSSSSRSFRGTGRLLSDETVPPAPQLPDLVVHNIVFSRNGFTVNNGHLMRLDDPENAQFLEHQNPSALKELEPAGRRASVHVNLVQTDGSCPEPDIRRFQFQGAGRTLGSSSSTESVPETTIAASIHTARSPFMGLAVDRSLPSTSIQPRLADGTRMVAHFNYHHTVADIRSFIDASRRGGSRTYQLQAVGFPTKVLADYSQTIEQAGLLNSVIIQKL